MSYLTTGWGYPWVVVVAILWAGVHEVGLRRLNARSTRAHAVTRRRRIWWSYAAIALVALSIVSPLEFWSMQYFWVHMVQHITVMLAAPAMYLAGAPAMPLVHAIPVSARRRWLRSIFLRPTRHWLRRAGGFLLSPFTGIIAFNVVMIVWMLPVAFNPIMARPSLHISLMLSTFLFSGLLFWVQFIPSAPFRPTLAPTARAGALLVTNVIMTVIAIALSFFTSVASYNFGLMSMHMGSSTMTMRLVTLSPFADQQLGAAILWVCGDFWCYPALVLAIRAAMRDETGSAVIDRWLRGADAVRS